MSELKPYLQIDLGRIKENALRFTAQAERTFGPDRTRTFFAVKSLPEEKVMKTVADCGLGFEVMTLRQAVQARSRTQPWIVSGFHKHEDLLLDAVDAEYFVIEGAHEIERLIRYEKPFNLLLRLKLETNTKIGFSLEELHVVAGLLKSRPYLKVQGLHFHLGWNVKDATAARTAAETIREAYQACVQSGLDIRVLNLGGSFCEHQTNEQQLPSRLEIYRQILGDLPVDFHFEPGRYIVGDAGTLFTQVIHVNHLQRVLHINTCAYGYKLNAATPRGYLMQSEPGVSERWTVYGFWSAEGDRCDLELRGRPMHGSILALENMGAYIWDLAFQFEPDRGVETRFIGAP